MARRPLQVLSLLCLISFAEPRGPLLWYDQTRIMPALKNAPHAPRRWDSSPTRSGPPQQASITPVCRSSHSTLGAHHLCWSLLPSPEFCPSSLHPSPVFASLPFPPPSLLSLPALLALLHSLQLCQVVQCSVPGSFLTEIANHYVGLSRALICLPTPFRVLGSQE